LHAAPAEIDVDEVRAFLAALPGVERVLDLHIWAMSTTETALTAHLQMPGTADHDQFLQQTARILHDKFDIDHTTLQIEQAPKRENCALECG
jgi:cobalt-zinc-cadmium efflux system protein